MIKKSMREYLERSLLDNIYAVLTTSGAEEYRHIPGQ
jgi:hypothetical protein